MTSSIVLRPASAADLPFLLDMLWEACTGPGPRQPRDEVLAVPRNALYLDGWKRPDDVGVVATEDDRPVGATWFRTFSPEQPAYGFVDAAIPELAIGIVDGQRGKGIGRLLLTALLRAGHDAGYARLSLSVAAANAPARALYARCGFTDVSHADDSYTMVANTFAP